MVGSSSAGEECTYENCDACYGDQQGVSPSRSWGGYEVWLDDSSYDRAWAKGEGGIVGETVAYV